MKKLFLTFGIALFGFTAAFAQDSDILQEEDLDRTENEVEAVEGEMDEAWEEGQEEVSLDALPVAVQDAVSTGEFSNMEIKKAYQTADAYIVVLEGDSGKKKVKVNEEGQIIESKDAHNKEDKETPTY